MYLSYTKYNRWPSYRVLERLETLFHVIVRLKAQFICCSFIYSVLFFIVGVRPYKTEPLNAPNYCYCGVEPALAKVEMTLFPSRSLSS